MTRRKKKTSFVKKNEIRKALEQDFIEQGAERRKSKRNVLLLVVVALAAAMLLIVNLIL
jgi:hypothetical protein